LDQGAGWGHVIGHFVAFDTLSLNQSLTNPGNLCNHPGIGNGRMIKIHVIPLGMRAAI
jgi:hypothetical protein